MAKVHFNADEAGGPGYNARPLRDGEPCNHPGCLSHLSHPCEGCGRIGGRYPDAIALERDTWNAAISAAIKLAYRRTDNMVTIPELRTLLKTSQGS